MSRSPWKAGTRRKWPPPVQGPDRRQQWQVVSGAFAARGPCAGASRLLPRRFFDSGGLPGESVPLQSTAECHCHCMWARPSIRPTRRPLQSTAEDLNPFTIVPSHHRIPGVHGRSSVVRRPSGTPTRHRDQYVQTAQACSCKNMYRAACSSQATISLQLQIAAATVPAWPYHSGRTLIRLGRAASRSFLISAGVTR